MGAQLILVSNVALQAAERPSGGGKINGGTPLEPVSNIWAKAPQLNITRTKSFGRMKVLLDAIGGYLQLLSGNDCGKDKYVSLDGITYNLLPRRKRVIHRKVKQSTYGRVLSGYGMIAHRVTRQLKALWNAFVGNTGDRSSGKLILAIACCF